VLASILVPRLLGDVGTRDLLLLAVLVAAAFAARIVVLFALLPPLEYFWLTQPISAAYKLAMTWGGLRGALTLVLALAVTENAGIAPPAQRFVAVLATGFVPFTLFANGTTLRPAIALSYAEVCDSVHRLAREYGLGAAAVNEIVEPYEAWIAAADARASAERPTERDQLAIALVALANQERVLILETRADRIASSATVQILSRNADALGRRRPDRGPPRLSPRRRRRAEVSAGVPPRLFRLPIFRRSAVSRRSPRRPRRAADCNPAPRRAARGLQP
jgi:CPA1 family monovalent cation:H+ antiporter